MSYNWDNVIWQSADGSWSRGYYERISRADSPDSWEDDDYDSEWDDDFTHDSFDTVRTGFLTEDAAFDWEPHGNPGSFWQIFYKGNSKECKALDQLAFFHANPDELKKHLRKEFLRKNREHFKALASEWTPDLMRGYLDSHRRLEVQIKGDDNAFEQWGSSSTVAGSLVKKGDWLEIEGKQIFNTKTDKFHKRVHKVAFYEPARYGYGRRW